MSFSTVITYEVIKIWKALGTPRTRSILRDSPISRFLHSSLRFKRRNAQLNLKNIENGSLGIMGAAKTLRSQ